MENNSNVENGEYKEFKEKKAPKKRQKMQDTRKGDNKLVVALVSILAAFVCFMVLVTVENRIVKGEVKTEVVVAAKDIPQGLLITDANMDNYFTVEQRNVEDIPAGSLNAKEMLTGKIVANPVLKKEVITYNHLILEDLSADVDDPVEMAIELSKVGQAVAGTLRAGDTIDMLVYYELPNNDSEETLGLSDLPEGSLLNDIPEGSLLDDVSMENTEDAQENVPAEQNVNESADVWSDSQDAFSSVPEIFSDTDEDITYSEDGRYVCKRVVRGIRVTGVYNSAGEDADMVAAAEGNMIATIVKVIVPRNLEAEIGLALEQGTVRLAKVLDNEPAVLESDGSDVPIEEVTEDSADMEDVEQTEE